MAGGQGRLGVVQETAFKHGRGGLLRWSAAPLKPPDANKRVDAQLRPPRTELTVLMNEYGWALNLAAAPAWRCGSFCVAPT